MPFNVPEEEKPAFNKKVQESLGLLAQDIGDTLGRVQSLQPQTLVDAYNQPVQAPVTRNLTPLEQYVYEPQPVPEVGSLTEMPAKESMVVPQEQPQVLSNFRNQAEAQFSRDMVSITPYEQAVTDVIGAEVDSLRNDAGEIASSPLEVFSKPLDANKVKALGFVDSEGNPTEKGELFFNLKESGVFNEDGTINEKGQAYLMPRSELKKPENNRAFKIFYDDQLDETPAADGEIMGAVLGFGKNLFTGAFNLLQTKEKLTSISGLYNIAKQTAAGKETLAELKTDQIAALEQVAKNFQNVGGYADIIQGLTGRLLYEGASAATGVPMEQMKAAAEENLYLARQRQWAANENLRDLEVGTIAEAITGIDGIVNMAREARDTLGEETFNQRYTGVSAVTELTGDPANLIPAAKAFKVATSAPIASRAIINAQKILGKTAQIEKALNEAQTIVEAGNTILKKEAVAVPLAQRLFTDISARAGANPELLARSQQAMDVAQRITASADEVRAAMPNAIASVDQLAAKRASLATRIPEEYAKKVVQTAGLGAKVRAMPASVMGSILEGTGETISKIDNAVTGYLSERGMDQAYNAALGAAGVVGLAGNPIVGAIGAGAAALKTGKFLTEYGKIFKYVGREMKNARGQIPFWKRVAYHTAPKSLGQGLSHTFNIFELGGATSDVLRRTGRGIVAAYPSDLFFEYLSDGGEMRPQTMTRAAAESFVLGGAFAAGGGAFMGTKQRMRELAIGDEINFRQGLVDTNQKARFEALPPVIKRSIATYSMANPTLNYNFIESGGSEYDPNSNTANINIYSTNPLKALVAHETLHHTIIKNNMEGGIAAMFLGDTKTNSVGGFFRSRDGKLDPEFEAFANKYYDRMRASGMSDAEIKTTYPLEKAAVEYFIEQHSDQYADMAESGELGAISARGEVRKKLGSILETILPKIPVLRDLHFKSGGAIDANGAFVTGVGILGDFGVSQNPIAKKMFREMNKRSSGMMPGQFEPLFSDKEGSGAPLFFDPANEIDVEMMHPMIQVDANDKPILKDGRPIALSKEIDMNRAIAGLSIVEAYRKLRDSNYAPEEGEAYVDEDGEFKPGWVSDSVLTQMFAKHQFNNEQKRMIRQTNKMVKEGNGQRMVMINFPGTTRNKAGKVVYKTQGATIRDTVPVAITIGKDGQVLYGLMSVTKLQENIKKRAQSRRGKKLYSGNIDLILRDVQAMMDFHKKGEDSINWFTEKYGVVEADQRKKFINTMFGLLNKKEQAVLNPMLLEDGIKSSDNVYRTYRADRVSKAIPMSPEEYAAMPFSYEAVSAVRMPEQRQMPEVSPEDLNPVANNQEAQGLWADGKRMFALNEMDEKVTPITSKEMLDSYSADAIGWMEPEQAPAPSQRFMPEKLDADYMKAVESGDVETQQRMVDEAAKKAGYDVGPVWHGSSSMNYNNRSEGLPFTVFDENKRELGFHFGTEEQARERANIPSGMKNMFRGYLKGPFGATVDYFQFDHNMESQVLLAANQSFDKLKNESGEIDKLTNSREYGADIKTKQKRHKILSGLVKGFPSEVLPERDDNIKERNDLNDKKLLALKNHIGKDQEKARELIKGMGFEGLAYPNRAEGKKPAVSYLVFDPSQIKSADPITRDDSGNIIPLSKRFDITSKDLRFMPEGVDEDKFYSQLDRVITDKVPTRATAAQIMATIDPTRGSGVKAEEIKWSGIEQALQSLEKDGKVSKEDLLNYLRNEGRVRFEEVKISEGRQAYEAERARLGEQMGRGEITSEEFRRLVDELDSKESQKQEPKYAQYQLPGGENYREVVLAMPGRKGKAQFEFKQKGNAWIVTRIGENTPVSSNDIWEIPEGSTGNNQRDRARKKAKDMNSEDVGSEYTSSHFPDIPNYVAHMRTNERVDADGRPGLFVEEFQSDRHQEGRKKGYNELEFQIPTDAKVHQLGKESGDGEGLWVIDIPTQDGKFDRVGAGKTIEEARKNALSRQANAGKVADAPFRTTWPIQLFKRALRDAVDSGKEWVGWTTGETQAERFDLSRQVDAVEIFKRDTGNWGVIATKNGNRVLSREATTTQLPDLIGKELAEKAVSEGGGTYKGDDLKVGGSGMKGFYDTMLPKEIGKYVKPFGGKVEKSEVATPSPTKRTDDLTDAELLQELNRKGDTVPIWKVSITPEMRQLAQGQMRFMPEKDSGAVDLMSQTSLNGDPFMIMSAKWGTPKQTSQKVSQSSKPENHIVGLSRIKGLMSAEDLTPKQKASLDDFLVKTASFAIDSPGFRDLGTPKTKEEALTVISKVVDRMARNLLAIYDAVPPPIRSYWQRWYPLAYNWNQEQAKNYSITRQVVAGINARLSPGKDWIHNVNMTERILKAFSDDVVMTKEIEDGAMPIIDSALEAKLNTRENKNKPKEWVAEQKEKAKAAKLELQKMIGLKLSQMTDAQAAQLIRYYTQVVGDNRVLNYFEQGTPVYADSISWQSFSNLEKAINMYRNPSMQNISENMGSDHKIRSFFNNQESPNDPVLRDVTSDTHAVAAAYLLPLSQSSQQVSRNFGGASNAVSGLNGMYYIVADAYRKAADARGVEPRAMQSITWEGARSMFPRGFKKAENVKKVEAIWNRFERKEITKSQALQEINQLLIDFFAKNPNSRPRFAVLPRQ